MSYYISSLWLFLVISLSNYTWVHTQVHCCWKNLSPCWYDLPGLDFWLQIYLLRLLRMSDQDVADEASLTKAWNPSMLLQDALDFTFLKCVRIQILGPKVPSKLNDFQAKPLSQFMSCLLFQSPKPNGLAACGLPVQRFQDLLPLEDSACQTVTAASRIAGLLGNTNSLRTK